MLKQCAPRRSTMGPGLASASKRRSRRGMTRQRLGSSARATNASACSASVRNGITPSNCTWSWSYPAARAASNSASEQTSQASSRPLLHRPMPPLANTNTSTPKGQLTAQHDPRPLPLPRLRPLAHLTELCRAPRRRRTRRPESLVPPRPSWNRVDPNRIVLLKVEVWQRQRLHFSFWGALWRERKSFTPPGETRTAWRGKGL